MGVPQCLLRSAPAVDKDVLSPLFNSIISYILGQVILDYPGVQVHLSDLAEVEDIVILTSSYSEMQGQFEGVNRNAAAVGMRIHASKTKLMSALISDEQRQAVLLDGEHGAYVGT